VSSKYIRGQSFERGLRANINLCWLVANFSLGSKICLKTGLSYEYVIMDDGDLVRFSVEVETDISFVELSRCLVMAYALVLWAQVSQGFDYKQMMLSLEYADCC
jgi:hypothetical protein